MKSIFRLRFSLALVLITLASISVVNSQGINAVITAIDYQPSGLVTSGKSLYVTTDVSDDVFFAAFECNQYAGLGGVLTFVGPENTSTGSGAYNPMGAMVASGSTLYGTGNQGSSDSDGCVFSVNTNGSDFVVLHTFGGSDGSGPEGGLALSGNLLYGTTASGGSHNDGTVFAMNTAGNFTNLYFFSGSDGANPQPGLVLSGSTLYGTTFTGGSNNYGAVFAINTSGSGYHLLHAFNGSDGANPQGALILSGNTLYGTTSAGGSNNVGLIFAVNTAGTDYNILHTFNSSEGYPQSPLVLWDDTLYGAASNTVSSDCILFSISNNGQEFSNVSSGFVFYLAGGLVLNSSSTNISLTGMGSYYGVSVLYTFGIPTTPQVTVSPLLFSTSQIADDRTSLTFQLSGPPGSNYVLQASTNLLNWSSISTSTIPASGSLGLSEAISSSKRQFY